MSAGGQGCGPSAARPPARGAQRPALTHLWTGRRRGCTGSSGTRTPPSCGRSSAPPPGAGSSTRTACGETSTGGRGRPWRPGRGRRAFPRQGKDSGTDSARGPCPRLLAHAGASARLASAARGGERGSASEAGEQPRPKGHVLGGKQHVPHGPRTPLRACAQPGGPRWGKGLSPAPTLPAASPGSDTYLKACTRFRSANSWSSTNA